MPIALAALADDEYAPFYAGYVARAREATAGAVDAVAHLAAQGERTAALLAGVPEARAGFRYAPGKWSVREVVGHLADTERIMAYRVLRIGRGDATPLPGFDQDAYMATSGFDARTLADLAEELAAVRQATVALLAHLDSAALARRGTASDKPVSVRALVGIIAGHELHHLAILKERYLV
jgi:uncharacterized damage-inducible protein DinB